jgi:WD40 repeat protein
VQPDSNPYPGPRPFDRADSEVFFGRDRELQDLLALVVSHQVVLLYAASGAGKSSLLSAALQPWLEDEEHFEVLPMARVRGLRADDAVPEGNVYVSGVLSHVAAADESTRSLPEFLAGRAHRRLDDGFDAPRALIIDQLEELFTAYPQYWEERGAFFSQLTQALKDDSLLRVVLSIREDFFAQLDPYARLLPDGLRTRYRLERLGPASALRATTEPARRGGRSFAPGVAEQLVEDLLQVRVDTGRETIAVRGEYVEPVQLQVACHSLWNALPEGVTEITEENRLEFGDVDEVLSRFYDEAIGAAAVSAHVGEDVLRGRFERAFITPMGTRGTVYWSAGETAGVQSAAIEELDARHLIRAELRAGARWYELTHDRLIEPVRSSNRARAARRRDRRRRRALAGTGVVALAAVGAIGALLLSSGTSGTAAAQDAKVDSLQSQVKALTAANKALESTLKAHDGAVTSVAFTPKALSILSVGRDGIAVMQPLAPGGATSAVRGRDREVTAAAFEPRSGATVYGWSDGEASVQGGQLLASTRLDAPISALAVNPARSEVALGTASGAVVLWDEHNGSTPLPVGALENPISTLTYAPGGRLLAAGDAGGRIRVWDLATGRLLKALGNATNGFVTPVFSADGSKIYVASTSGQVQVRSTTRPLTTTLLQSDGGIAGIAATRDVRALAVLFKNGEVRILDRRGQMITSLRPSAGGVLAAAWSPRGDRLATAQTDGTVLIWNPLPDLVVIGATVHTRPDQAILVAEVTNRGASRSAATAINGVGEHPPGQTFQLQGLDPGASADVTWNLYSFGELRVTVNPERTAVEASYANNTRVIIRSKPGAGKARIRIVAAALAGATQQARIHYSFGANRFEGVLKKIRLPRVPSYADSSSFVTWCYWQAGAPDPNGSRYNGVGYTGTLVAHGVQVSKPQPGDLVFYGPSATIPVHVAVYVGEGRVVSHGSEDGPILAPINYRPDLLQIRSYLPAVGQ